MTKRMIKNASYEGERPLFASRHLVFPESAHEGYPRGSAQDVP